MKKSIILLFPFLFLFFSCNRQSENLIWRDYREVKDKDAISITLSSKQNKEKNIKLKTSRSKYIPIIEDSYISSLSHRGDYLLEIYPNKNLNKSSALELFLYPFRNIIENDNEYIVPELSDIEFYYIENYDEEKGQNYFTVSKDNKISKGLEIEDLGQDIDAILNKITDDISFYVPLEEKLGIPYNGFIVKSHIDNSYIYLSTLWGN